MRCGCRLSRPADTPEDLATFSVALLRCHSAPFPSKRGFRLAPRAEQLEEESATDKAVASLDGSSIPSESDASEDEETPTAQVNS